MNRMRSDRAVIGLQSGVLTSSPAHLSAPATRMKQERHKEHWLGVTALTDGGPGTCQALLGNHGERTTSYPPCRYENPVRVVKDSLWFISLIVLKIRSPKSSVVRALDSH